MSLLSLIRDLTLRGAHYKVAFTAAFTINKSHAGKILPCDGTFAVTVPAPSAEYFAGVEIVNTGTGTITVVSATGFPAGTSKTTTLLTGDGCKLNCQPNTSKVPKWSAINSTPPN
jgi:hypothetical protein